MALPRKSIAHWRAKLGNVLLSADDVGWISVTSPVDLVRLDTVRQLASARGPLGAAVASDVFLFAKGEPPAWPGLIVGGNPRRAAGRRWPCTTDGHSMTFLAQFTFTDSLDLVGDLPGDTLLIFATSDELSWPDDHDQLQFEWYSVAECAVTEASQIPEPEWEFVRCWGELVRTCDYVEPQAANLIEESLRTSLGGTSPSCDIAATQLAVIGGSKIGGVPLGANELLAPFDSYRFLCSLATISPRANSPYPWTNLPKPLSFGEACSKDSTLNVRDGFVLDFFLTPRGEVDWTLRFA